MTTNRSTDRKLSVVLSAGEGPVTLAETSAAGRDQDRAEQVILELVQGAAEVHITGSLTLTTDEIWDVSTWVQVLPEPQILAWREEHTGERHVRVSSEHHLPPIQGPVVVCWRCRGQHPFWTALLAGEDLVHGEERKLEPQHVVAVAAERRIAQNPSRNPHSDGIEVSPSRGASPSQRDVRDATW